MTGMETNIGQGPLAAEGTAGRNPDREPAHGTADARAGQIYRLIGKVIGKIRAIGKDRVSRDRNGTEQFRYRGIDQVYNALNPVMAELGIFFCPEVLDQKREERITRGGTALTFTTLTMRFTAYAPDGSSVSMTVVGEGMDSGDKSSTKAMSVAMKYAMFQLFCIPTEEMPDPDADIYQEILPDGAAPDTAKPESGAAYILRMKKVMEAQMSPEFDFAKARLELIARGEVESMMKARRAFKNRSTGEKYIYRRAGKYRLAIRNSRIAFERLFGTLQEAISKREAILAAEGWGREPEGDETM